MTRNAIGYIPQGEGKSGRLSVSPAQRKAMLSIEAASAGYLLLHVVFDTGDEEAAVDALLERAYSDRANAIFIAGGKSGLKDPALLRRLEEKCAELVIDRNW